MVIPVMLTSQGTSLWEKKNRNVLVVDSSSRVKSTSPLASRSSLWLKVRVKDMDFTLVNPRLLSLGLTNHELPRDVRLLVIIARLSLVPTLKTLRLSHSPTILWKLWQCLER